MSVRFKFLVALLPGAMLAACTTTETSERMLVDPAQYAIYACKDLYNVLTAEKAREAKLRGLMAKAETGPMGGLVSEMAYRTEYMQSRGNQRVAQDTLKQKDCPPPPTNTAKPG